MPKYVVTGKLQTPTTDQIERARLTGGWKEKIVNGVEVMWNPCVSPPFGGGMDCTF